MKVLLAAFYTPGIRAIEHLIQAGVTPDRIFLLTHEAEVNKPLLSFARWQGIEPRTFHPTTKEAVRLVERFKPDVLFSLYYRHLVPHAILKRVPLGSVNLHPSLLPKYRGAFSSPWVIINGESKTGFSYHYMTEKFDAGNILVQRTVRVRHEDTAYSLYHRLIERGLQAFEEAFDLVTRKRHPGRCQSGKPSYYSRKLPFDGMIDPAWDRARVERFIRAMYFPPHPGAQLRVGKGRLVEVRSLEDYDRLMRKHDVNPGRK